MSIAASWVAATVLLLRVLPETRAEMVNVLLWGFVAVRLLLPFSIESSLSLLPRTEVIRPAAHRALRPDRSGPMIGTTAAVASGAAQNPLPIWTILAWVWLFGVRCTAFCRRGQQRSAAPQSP